MESFPVEQNGVGVESRFVRRAEFHRLAEVPPETEWFANIDNENTRRAYRNDGGLHPVSRRYEAFHPLTTGSTEMEATKHLALSRLA